MKHRLCILAGGIVFMMAGIIQAAVYDNVYWVGGDGEWTGNVTASPEYATGNWSSDPNAASGLPAKFVLGRNDGMRVNAAGGEVVGAGGFDLDRVPCNEPGCTTTPIPGGTNLGTDVYINKPVTVWYNPNRQFLTGDDGLDRFGDFRFQPNAAFPGTPTLNLSNGATFEHQTTFGGDEDGMWTRWNGAELNIDNATFRRTADIANGFAGGAFMLASYHGYANSLQTVSLTNGGRIENHGQLWWGVSDFDLLGGNQPGISITMTINDGHLDLTGGDSYELDNDGLPLRADMAFIYTHTPDGDANPADNEKYVINFTGPGTITVDGKDPNPLDGHDGAGTNHGGIRVARQTGATVPVGTEMHAVYEGGTTQASYLDLWNLGILRAKGKSGLTGDIFSTFFTTTNNPGDNDYKLTSLVVPGIAGDYNDNGVVDAADYVVWKNGDSPNDTQAGYDLWKANFGKTAGSGASVAAVPEPGTMVLMLAGLAFFLGGKRSRVG